MNVQIAKVFGVVALMLGILGALIGCIALKADSTVTLGLATAFGAAATGVVQWLTKTNGDKSRPPTGPLAVLLVAAASSLAAPGCMPSQTPRETARSVVLTLAEGVKQGDVACASVAMAKGDKALADACTLIVYEARAALLAAENGVDAWDAAAVQNLPCAAKNAASALSKLLDTLKRAGGKSPPVVEDALRLAPALAGVCRG